MSLWLLGGAGCFSEPSSVTSEASSGDTSSGDTRAEESSSGSSSEAGDSTGSRDASSDSDAGHTGSASSSDDGSSTDTDACGAAEPPAVLWAEEATIVDPMELVPAVDLPDERMMARSYAGQSGTITFTFELPCPKTVEIHALVRDTTAGTEDNDPDSYFVRVDDEDEEVWTYGCGSADHPDGTWLWQRVAGTTRGACEAAQLAFDLPAGSHALTLRNRESGGAENYAAIVAVVVSSDPALDPITLYDPAG